MRILFVASRYDYGQPHRGYSFERLHLFDSLDQLGHDLIEFDYPTLAQDLPPRSLNDRLLDTARREKPDLLFAVVRGGLLKPKTIRRVSDELGVPTVNWYCDDHWQFDTESVRWTPAFDWVVTTADTALPRYAERGWSSVIKSQWAANPHRYPKHNLPPQHDVTFVGQPYGQRIEAVDTLRRAGLNVETWGRGWPAGSIDHDQLVRVFNQSRINLNFADASHPALGRDEKLRANPWVQRVAKLPGLWRVTDALDRRITANKQQPTPRQIKGRVFEVPAAGGFLLTQPAENLDDYLEPGREIATFESIDELVDRCRYYLNHEDERRAIAEAGHRRVLDEHTWRHRFEAIFAHIDINTHHRQREAA